MGIPLVKPRSNCVVEMRLLSTVVEKAMVVRPKRAVLDTEGDAVGGVYIYIYSKESKRGETLT